MKSAEEFLKEKKKFESWMKQFCVHENVCVIDLMKEFAFEVAKESLKNASINATSIITGEGIMDHEVDKQSILSLKNIPEL